MSVRRFKRIRTIYQFITRPIHILTFSNEYFNLSNMSNTRQNRSDVQTACSSMTPGIGQRYGEAKSVFEAQKATTEIIVLQFAQGRLLPEKLR